MAPLCAKQMLLTEYGANPWLANHKGKTPQQAVGGTRRHCKDVFKVSPHHPQLHRIPWSWPCVERSSDMTASSPASHTEGTALVYDRLVVGL